MVMWPSVLHVLQARVVRWICEGQGCKRQRCGHVASADSGLAGRSGRIAIKSGDSTAGNSGAAESSGAAAGGAGGSVAIAVGSGDTGAGGAISAVAGGNSC